MKELQWIKELEEDFESGEEERFPKRAHLTHWENIPADDDHRKFIQGVNKIYLPFAKKGDEAEMRHLGEYFCIGRERLNLPVNYKKAIFWYRRAAEHKSLYRGDVLYMLAYCYKHAKGADKDKEKAFKMLDALAKIDCSKIELPEMAQFTARANVSLADCYYKGMGTEKNCEKAFSIWQEYADKGDALAIYNLGVLYFEGKPKKDYKRAYELFNEAMLCGDVRALNNLGWCCEKGYGTEKDMDKAVKYYKEAAECGHRTARNNLKRLKKEGVISYDGDY